MIDLTSIHNWFDVSVLLWLGLQAKFKGMLRWYTQCARWRHHGARWRHHGARWRQLNPCLSKVVPSATLLIWGDATGHNWYASVRVPPYNLTCRPNNNEMWLYEKTSWGWVGPSSAKIEAEVETEWSLVTIGNIDK